jgi:hypothetical protein
MTIFPARPMPVATMPVDFRRNDFQTWAIPIKQAPMSRHHIEASRRGRKLAGVEMNRTLEGNL